MNELAELRDRVDLTELFDDVSVPVSCSVDMGRASD